MQDTIILGNGTSKQIKTALLPNSYAEFKAMAENGNLFADIKLNANGCEVVGTPLNKQNLLTDETAGKIGNPENIDKAIKNLVEAINSKSVTITRTVIFEGRLAYNGTVNLAQPISDFDFIMIYTINQNCKAIPTTFFDVKTALEKINEDGYISTFQVANDQFQVSITSYANKITNNTIIGKGANTTLKVVGIKLST